VRWIFPRREGAGLFFSVHFQEPWAFLKNFSYRSMMEKQATDKTDEQSETGFVNKLASFWQARRAERDGRGQLFYGSLCALRWTFIFHMASPLCVLRALRTWRFIIVKGRPTRSLLRSDKPDEQSETDAVSYFSVRFPLCVGRLYFTWPFPSAYFVLCGLGDSLLRGEGRHVYPF
jgi:hypothetical protein